MTEAARLLEITKQEIRSVLLAAPKGCPLEKFCAEYSDLTGRPLPFSALGYGAVENFLESIPDVVRIQWSSRIDGDLLTAVADETTKHMEKLVSRQKVNGNSKSLRKPQPVYGFNSFNQPFRVRPAGRAFLPAAAKVKINQIMKYYVDGINLTNFMVAYRRNVGEELNFQQCGFNTLEECVESIPGLVIRRKDHHQPRIYMSSVKRTENKFSGATPSRVKQKESAQIRQVENTTRGISGYASSQAPLQKSTSKYADSNNIVETVDDFTQPGKNYGMVDYSGISDAMQQDFKKILRNHPNGIWARLFCDAYKALTRCRLDLSGLGYYSLLELVDALPGVFARQQPDGCKIDWLLFSADTPKENLQLRDLKNACSSDINSAVSSSENNTNEERILQSKRKGVPTDAVLPGAQYECQTFPTAGLNSKSYFPVLLGKVAKPDRFCIQLEGKETSQALEELMDGLRECYHGKQGGLYEMENKHILIGSICAGIWTDNNWYRIRIISIDDLTGYVSAYCVDFGNTVKVPRSNLRYLKKDFAKLPSQALVSRLAFIEPANEKTWSSTAKDRFLNLSMEETLMARICDSPYHEDVLNLWLCNTNGEEDIHINKVLVDEGFAMYCDEKNKREEPGQPSRTKMSKHSLRAPKFSSAAAQHAGEASHVQKIPPAADATSTNVPMPNAEVRRLILSVLSSRRPKSASTDNRPSSSKHFRLTT